MNGLENILAEIRREAEEAAALTLSRAEATVRAMQDASRADCARVAAAQDAAILRDKEEVASRTDAACSMIRRRTLLSGKSAPLDEAYRRAHDHFMTLDAESREALASSLLEGALLSYRHSLGERALLWEEGEGEVVPTYEVTLCTRDLEAFGKTFLADFKKSHLSLGEDLLSPLALSQKGGAFDGGLILRLGEMEMNCTLSMLLTLHRQANEETIYRTLFAE